jgi:hypothetical protein
MSIYDYIIADFSAILNNLKSVRARTPKVLSGIAKIHHGHLCPKGENDGSMYYIHNLVFKHKCTSLEYII